VSSIKIDEDAISPNAICSEGPVVASLGVGTGTGAGVSATTSTASPFQSAGVPDVVKPVAPDLMSAVAPAAVFKNSCPLVC
jgi:hypothetical protein